MRLMPTMQFSHPQSDSPSRRTALIPLVGGLLVALTLVASAYSQPGSDNTAGAQRLFSLINQERVKAGVPPLQFDERLAQAARKHTQLMVQENSLSHQFEGEEPLQLRVSEQNARCDRDGENIALDSDLEDAHVMLMQSPPHRANILSPQFSAVGIGVLKTDELFYVTEDFAHVLPDYSEPEADATVQRAISQYAKSQGVPVPTRKPLPKLKAMACDMALDDELASKKAGAILGVTSAVAWNASDLEKLPLNLQRLLSQPLNSGYSLGVCFAPSVTHPGGVYWLVMVIY
jgi:uncharacterized protein YkwD